MLNGGERGGWREGEGLIAEWGGWREGEGLIAEWRGGGWMEGGGGVNC